MQNYLKCQVSAKLIVFHPSPGYKPHGGPVKLIGHFTVVCYETWPLNGSEAKGDLALTQTSLYL